MDVTVLSPAGSRTKLALIHTQTIADLKAALLASWPGEFGTVPVQGGQLRFIHAGKVLTDAQTLGSLQGRTESGVVGDDALQSVGAGAEARGSLVVHVSVRPASVVNGDGQVIKTEKKGGCCVVS